MPLAVTALGALWAVTVTVIGYLYVSDMARLADLEHKVDGLAVKVMEEYVRKDDFTRFEERVLNTLERIEDKIDRKQ